MILEKEKVLRHLKPLKQFVTSIVLFTGVHVRGYEYIYTRNQNAAKGNLRPLGHDNSKGARHDLDKN